MARGIRHLVLAVIVLTVVVAVGSLIQSRTHAASVNVPDRSVVTQPGRALPTAQDTVAQLELRNVQAAVMALMMDNSLASLQPLPTPTFDMSAFPDPTSSVAAKGLGPLDKGGYVLFGNDELPDNASDYLEYYMTTQYTMWKYTVDPWGFVTHHESAVINRH